MMGVLAAWTTLVLGFAAPPEECKKSYIVVGAGGAGNPMAYGLAKAGCKVTVVEKGPDDDWTGPFFGVDGAYPLWVWELSWVAAQNFMHYEIASSFWSVDTWEVPRAGNANLNTCGTYCPDGPVQGTEADALKSWTYAANIVGGNTAHNLGFWLRGDCSLYEMFGPEWGCAATTKSFEEMEAMYAAVSATSYGDMLNAEKSGYLTQADKAAMDGLEATGFVKVPGRMVGAKGYKHSYGATEWTSAAIGSTWFPGEPARITTGKVFIDPIRGMKDFTLITRAWAEKLLFSGSDTVSGVEYTDMTSMEKKQIYADEVILTLGGLLSAQLMLVSGIGPKAELEALGIPVVHDLPVGTTYQNHVWAPGMYCKKPETVVALEPGKSTDTFKIYPGLSSIETPFPKSNGNVFAAGLSSVAENEGVADYAIAVMNNLLGGPLDAMVDCSPLAQAGYGEYSSGSMVVVGIMQSKSRGTLKIKSASMHDDPIYDPNFLSHPDDLTVITEGFAALRAALSPERGFVELAPQPGNEVPFTKAAAGTFWHDSSTTPIGLVVDEELKVYGMKGLRVADTSVQVMMTNTPTSPVAQLTGYHGSKIVLKEAF